MDRPKLLHFVQYEHWHWAERRCQPRPLSIRDIQNTKCHVV